MIKLEENEKIIHEVRKHPFVMVASGVSLVAAALVPLAFLFVVGAIGTVTVNAIASMTPMALFLYSVWLLGMWVFFFLAWTDYYLDVWYVTDRRIIDIEQRGIFSREVISLRFDTIQDITVDTRGVVQTMLGFGDLHVQTAGADREIVLQNARNPEAARSSILALQGSVK